MAKKTGGDGDKPKGKGDKPSNLLPPEDIGEIVDQLKANAKKRADDAVRQQNIKLVDNNPHTSDAAKRVDKKFDNIEKRVSEIEQELSGETKPVPRDAIRALVDNYSLNGNLDDDTVKKIVTKIKETFPTVSDDVIKEVMLEKMGRDFGKEMALYEALDNGEIPTAEAIEKMGKMFTAYILAEERGVDPDFSEFRTPVTTAVEAAVDRYAEHEKIEPGDNLHRRMHEVAKLFTPDATWHRGENRAYRFLTRNVKARAKEDNIGFYMLFSEQRDYHKDIDIDAVKKLMRRLDSGVRELDPIGRDEFIFNFVDKILNTDSSTTGFRGWLGINTDDFAMLPENSRKWLRDLVMLYFYAKAHYEMSAKGYEAVNRQFSGKALDELIKLPDYKDERPWSTGGIDPVRYVGLADYTLLLNLSKALYNALPDKFRDSVEAAMIVAKIHNPDITTANTKFKLFLASKNLREAFIAIAQNRGTFENFFTALHHYFSLLDQELQKKVQVASYMVGLYDSLELSIPDVLNESRKRILEEPLF